MRVFFDAPTYDRYINYIALWNRTDSDWSYIKHDDWYDAEDIFVHEYEQLYTDVMFVIDSAAKSRLLVTQVFPDYTTLEDVADDIIDEMNAFVDDMDIDDSLKPIFYCDTDSSDWVIEDTEPYPPLSGVEDLLYLARLRYGWPIYRFNNIHTRDGFWDNRIDTTDPANKFEFEWHSEHIRPDDDADRYPDGMIDSINTPHIFDPPMGENEKYRGAGDYTDIYWMPQSRGKESDLPGVHGKYMDILVYISCDVNAADLGGGAFLGGNSLIVNMIGHSSLLKFSIKEYVAGLWTYLHGYMSTLLHELGHCYGLVGTERLPGWGNSVHYWKIIDQLPFAWGAIPGIMDYFEHYGNNRLCPSSEEIFKLYSTLHSEYRPVLRWGWNHAHTEMGYYMAGNIWNFDVVPY
jgi:hypothetical protein